MKRTFLTASFVFLTVLMFSTSAVLADGWCPPWRPCGPGNTWGGNLLIPQGFYGADFRPACANHDACLASGMYSRRDCDRMFYNNMLSSCANSSNPAACERRARHYYVTVRLLGGFYR